MAAVDRQIFQLTPATVTFLQSMLAMQTRMAAVIQVDGYNLDFAVDFDVLIQFIQANSGSQVLNGTANPSNSIGNNGDLYKQTNGRIYLKAGNAWQLLNGGTAGYVFTISSASPTPYPLNSTELANVNAMGKRPMFTAWVPVNNMGTITETQFNDIYPIYQGQPGAYTQIQVYTHGGEDTIVQFS